MQRASTGHIEIKWTNSLQIKSLVSYTNAKNKNEVVICSRLIVEVTQLCPSLYCPGDNVDQVVISEPAPVTKVEVKDRALLEI